MTVATALVLHFKHTWFFAVFVFCGIIVLANVVHYVLFRVLKKREQQQSGFGQAGESDRYLSHPARAIFFLTCGVIVLPLVPDLPARLQ